MKFTAFITSTTARMVMTSDIVLEPTVMPPTGSETICTPCQASRPAARIWPASLVNQDRS